MTPTPSETTDVPAPISLRQAWPFWLKVGFISFGGPAGQIALLHECSLDYIAQQTWQNACRVFGLPGE
jgi:chromate transporter